MELTIANVGIRQDDAGRYCINDLHRAAGGESRHQPGNWLRNQQTRELIDELDQIPHFRGIEVKQGVGTFVCKELVYSYAMWISPAFNLKVIRTFDAVSKSQIESPEMQMARGLLAANALIEEKNILIAQLQPQVDALHRIATADGSLTVTDAAKSLQVKPFFLFTFLSSHRWVYRRLGTGWIGYQDKIQQGLLEHKVTTIERADHTEKLTQQVRITAKGMTRLSEILCGVKA